MIVKYLFALVLLLVCVPFSVESQEQKAQKLVTSVHADFIQEKHLAILARPLISKGEFVFQEPNSLRWEYFTPLHTVLLMNDGNVRKFVKHDEIFKEEQGMGVDAMQIVLQEITGWLDGEVTDTPTFSVKSSEDNVLVLTPKKESFSQFISRIELRLADQVGLMESVTLYEGSDSYTKMVFSNGILNEKIPVETFVTP